MGVICDGQLAVFDPKVLEAQLKKPKFRTHDKLFWLRVGEYDPLQKFGGVEAAYKRLAAGPTKPTTMTSPTDVKKRNWLFGDLVDRFDRLYEGFDSHSCLCII